MNLLQRISRLFGSTPDSVKNTTVTPSTGYANPTAFGTGNDGIKTSVTMLPSGWLHEMRPWDRRECIKRSRYADNNLGIVKALNEGIVDYSLGSGVNAYACTGDPQFDSAADKFTEEWFENPALDLCGEQCFYELVPVAARAMVVDGDMGNSLLLAKDPSGRPFKDAMPQLQLFLSDQIGDPISMQDQGKDGWYEGVKRNSFRKALAYRVLKNVPGTLMSMNSTLSAWEYDARDFILLLDRKRIGMGRGIPWSHHGQGNAFSMMDLAALKDKQEYFNTYFAAVIEGGDGSIREALDTLSTNGTPQDLADITSAGASTTKRIQRDFLNFFGGGAVLDATGGGKLNFIQRQSDNGAFVNHMSWLVTNYCLGYKIPPSLFWAIVGVGSGPERRMTLAQAQWVFNSFLTLITRRLVKPVRDWLLLWGLLTGRLNNGKMPRTGADYRSATFHGPRDMTIDERYFHKTWMERLKDGNGTAEEYFSLQGQNGKKQRFRRIQEIKEDMDECDRIGVPYDRYKALQPGQQFTDPNADPADDIAPPLDQNLAHAA
jgi:capsid protein